MKTIDVVFSVRQINRVLSCLDPIRQRRFFVVFQQAAPALQEKLVQSGWTPAPEVARDEDRSGKFLNEYLGAIDECNRQQRGSRLWWSTYIASKNRFASPIPSALQQLYTIMELLRTLEFDHLIIVNPSWTILRALEQVVVKEDVAFSCPSFVFRKLSDVLYGQCYYRASVVVQMVRVVVRVCQARWILGPVRKTTISQDQTLHFILKSFILEHSFRTDGYCDVFFGSLLPLLQQSRSVIVFGTILGPYRRCLERIKKITNTLIIPLEQMITMHEIFYAGIKLLFLQLHIRRPVKFFGYDIQSIINNELIKTVNGIELINVLHFDAMLRLVRVCPPISALYYTYENNPWERMCISALRQDSSTTQIIGYQQNVVPQASANLFTRTQEHDQGFLPDRIITTGEIPKDLLQHYGRYPELMIRSGCALRLAAFQPNVERVNAPHDPYHVLVAMEGIIEVYKMVNLVLHQLSGKAQYAIRIRAHPVLPLDAIRRYLIVNPRTIGNVEISRCRSLTEDIEWSDVVVYWGSTVALESLTVGKRLVYYDNGSMLSFDPLFQCPALKRTVTYHNDLGAAINELCCLPSEIVEREYLAASEYIKNYFLPVDEQRMCVFL
ncbi:hypothetical protein HZA86_00405 [Candidatus Uhrbacteria bacterium]|nr:hypothetical protein [Candidatus Uhrbacteria bacterium]